MNRRFFAPVNKRRIPGSFNRAGALLVLGLVAFCDVSGSVRSYSTRVNFGCGEYDPDIPGALT